jgi:enamine deaminase RidA (YjgF/YER057c/UK114 family)
VEILAPDGWAAPRGYADGVAAEGRIIVTAGQIGWDPTNNLLVSLDFAAQARQALANVIAVLRAGGAEPSHLVRLTWFVTDREAYAAARRDIGAAYRELVGHHYPAMSVIIVAGRFEPGAKVEIEATAVVPSPAPR